MSDAFNEELHDLADAGCPVIQMEEPQIHLLAARGYMDQVINPEFMLKVFNNTVKGLRAKTEVWCHTCWGNPSQQRMFATVQSYKPALELLNQVDADVITFEMASSNVRGPGGRRARRITTMKVGDRRDRPPHAAGGVARGGGAIWCGRRCKVHPAGAAGPVVGLRDGPRRDEPAARVLQDGGAGAGREHREAGARPAGDAESPAADPKFSLIRTSNESGCMTAEVADVGASMINAAMVGLGWWGKTLVESVQGTSDDIQFVAGAARTQSRRADGALPTAQGLTLRRHLRGAAGRPDGARRSCWRRRIRCTAPQVDRGGARPASTSSARSRSR